MKKTIINLGLVLVAFALGVSINNACSKSIEDMTDSELRQLVIELQNQVNELKSKVAKLESSAANSGSNGGFDKVFYVGKVPFLPNGTPDIDLHTQVDIEMSSFNKVSGQYDYYYKRKENEILDSQGRILGKEYSYEIIEDNIGIEASLPKIDPTVYSYTNDSFEMRTVTESAAQKVVSKSIYKF